MKPRPEAKGILEIWQRSFEGMAPGTSTLRERTRSVLCSNRVMSGDAAALAMIVQDKVYLSIDMVLTKLLELGHQAQRSNRRRARDD